MGLVRDHATRAGSGAGLQTGPADGDGLTGHLGHVDPVHTRLQSVNGGRNPQRLALFSGPVLAQVPRRIERALIIGEPDPEGW